LIIKVLSLLIMSSNEEFMKLLNLYYSGKNILMHGPGGTGKTHCIKELVSSEEFTSGEIVYALLAPTGTAACNIGGNTIHSYFQIPPIYNSGSQDEAIASAVAKSRYRGRKLQLIIIDEISMVGKEVMTIMDLLLRKNFDSSKPMGGVQCIFSGDFFQLPPVKQDWAFEAQVWGELAPEVLEFANQKRYSCQNTFDLLMRLRIGQVSDSDKEWLARRCLAYKNGEHKALEVAPVELYTRNVSVDEINAAKLRNVAASPVQFRCVDTISKRCNLSAAATKKILCELADEICVLKVDVPVLLYRNYSVSDGLTNGRLAKIMEINEPEKYVRIMLDNGTTHIIRPKLYEIVGPNWTIGRTQFPIRATWAITNYKAQGMTIPRAIMKLDDCHNPGQIYTTLARVVSIDEIYLIGIDYSLIRADKKVLTYFREQSAQQTVALDSVKSNVLC
jgi:ATP-dependent DNA helicase PIF1